MRLLVVAFLLICGVSAVAQPGAVEPHELVLRPNPGPELLPTEPGWRPWAILGLIVLAAVLSAAAYRSWRRLRQRNVVLPPDKAALAELAKLRSMSLAATVEIDQFLVSASAVLRRYLNEQFSLPALQLTTAELLVSIQASNVLRVEQTETAARLLKQADGGKFAKRCSSQEEARQWLGDIEQFIQETSADGIR